MFCSCHHKKSLKLLKYYLRWKQKDTVMFSLAIAAFLQGEKVWQWPAGQEMGQIPLFCGQVLHTSPDDDCLWFFETTTKTIPWVALAVCLNGGIMPIPLRGGNTPKGQGWPGNSWPKSRGQSHPWSLMGGYGASSPRAPWTSWVPSSCLWHPPPDAPQPLALSPGPPPWSW